MLPAAAHEAFSTLAAALGGRPELGNAVRSRWRAGGEAMAVDLTADVRAAADRLGALLPALTQGEGELSELGNVFAGDAGEVLFSWCAASTWRRDARIAKLLTIAAANTAFRERVVTVARERVVEGPLLDALACAPLLGDGLQLALPENTQARARLEILVWEAGASALEAPELGRWLWGSPDTFEAMIRGPARGTLRGRVRAARCLEVSVRGMPKATDPELVGRTLQVLQPLLLHPEPLVWVHAARALGRLTGPLEQLEGTLLDWVLGESRVLRQRAMTAVASVPADRLMLVGSQLVAVINSRDEEPWVLAAVAAATPYLFFERRDLWDRLAKRILAGEDPDKVASREALSDPQSLDAIVELARSRQLKA